jgi:hypothetical protein
MRNKTQKGFLLINLIFLSTNIFGQTKEWKTEKAKDGKTVVKSAISKRTDERGKAVQLIEYIATTTANVSLSNCISVLKDVTKHKIFIDEKETNLVKAISDSEWIVYYYFNAPWPMADADCVIKMVSSEDPVNTTTTFTLTAAPTLFEKKEVQRITYYNVIYQFKSIGDDKVEMTVSAKISPVVQAPAWLVRGFFPDGPADVLQKILTLAEGSRK